jgi:diguanylate cyclase (GGDEF)-like protein
MELEQAMAGHAEWLKNWHLAVVGHVPVDGRTDWRDPAEGCPLQQWFKSPSAHHFADHPGFEDLGEKLEAVHERARMLARVARESGMVPGADYSLFMAIVLDLSDLVRRLQTDTWNRLANIDPLTGVGNQQAMYPRLDVEWDRCRRTKQPCCVALVDLDGLAKINDEFGFPAGDAVLKTVAGLLSGGIRPYDHLFRYGGEEFLVCLPNTDIVTARTVMERLRERIAAAHIPVAGTRVAQVTCSFAITPLVPDDGVAVAIDRVEQAMETAKEEGRDRVVVWRPPVI